MNTQTVITKDALEVFNIDPSHTRAAFSIKHMMISKVHGAFEKISGKLYYNAKDVTQSRLEVSIEAASVNTHEPQRDAHLRGADFFDVEKYPNLTFKSIRVDKVDDGLKILGELTIHGVTKQITLDVEQPTGEVKDPWGNTKIGASGTAKLKRKDFGLVWNGALEAGGFLVGDDVTITIDAEFTKQV